MSTNLDWKKYLIVFLITVCLFLTASYVSNYFGGKKIDQIKSIQDKISVDILSSETEYSLLSDLSCKTVSDSVLSAELEELGRKLEWSEINIGTTDEVNYLRKYYALLEIKDYLLVKKISARCGVKAAFILFFYPRVDNCIDCDKQRVVLSTLREKYPELRVYAFDYSTDLSAVKAMLHIYKIENLKDTAVVIDDDVFTGFQSIDILETRVKESFKLQEKQTDIKSKTTTTTTTTKAPATP